MIQMQIGSNEVTIIFCKRPRAKRNSGATRIPLKAAFKKNVDTNNMANTQYAN